MPDCHLVYCPKGCHTFNCVLIDDGVTGDIFCEKCNSGPQICQKLFKKMDKRKEDVLSRCESPIEEQFAKAFYTATNVWPEPQISIAQYRVDFVIGDNTVIECDGHDFHSTKPQREKDNHRDRVLTKLGYRIARFTGSEIHRNAKKCALEAIEIAGEIFAN